jgi:IS30 family transposase
LDVHSSRIGKELQRNKGGKGYRYQQAHEKALLRRNCKPNKKINTQMATTIEEKLH